MIVIVQGKVIALKYFDEFSNFVEDVGFW